MDDMGVSFAAVPSTRSFPWTRSLPGAMMPVVKVRMNPRQKAAIAVGVTLILLLVLHPAYVGPDGDDLRVHEWIGAEPPPVTWRWIGSDPPERLGYVERAETVLVDRRMGRRPVPPPYETIEYPDGRTETRVLPRPPPILEEEERTVRTLTAMPFRLAASLMAFAIATTLALTVAAVVVLRTREAGA